MFIVLRQYCVLIGVHKLHSARVAAAFGSQSDELHFSQWRNYGEP